ncbi:MAG TPA: hypothetical protein VE441_07280 [Mycobacterium sp.]|jgi:hypothetical protein|nr:hypothetical protein [Mycobacterium sp.]
MRAPRFGLLLATMVLVASCGSSEIGDRSGASVSSNPHPYPPSIDRHGKTYDAVPAALTAVMIDNKDARTLHAFIDIRPFLRDASVGCLANYWTGGVRRSDSSSVVVAAALYAWQPPLAEASHCNFFVSGSGLPDVEINIGAPLGSRNVVDASTGKPVPLVDEPPH